MYIYIYIYINYNLWINTESNCGSIFGNLLHTMTKVDPSTYELQMSKLFMRIPSDCLCDVHQDVFHVGSVLLTHLIVAANCL